MPTIHDVVTKNRLPTKAGQPGFFTLTDKTKDVWYSSSTGVEPLSGSIAALLTGDAAAVTFTVGTIPANCVVDQINVIVVGTAGTAATTIALGITGTTGKYMTASSFGSTMATAGVKSVTTIKIHETGAQTVIATFSAAWDAGAKVIVQLRYFKLPPTS